MNIKSKSEYELMVVCVTYSKSDDRVNRPCKKIIAKVLNATHRWSAAKRFYIVNGVNPIGSEPRKIGVEDLPCGLGDDTLSVVDSVEAVICKRLS